MSFEVSLHGMDGIKGMFDALPDELRKAGRNAINKTLRRQRATVANTIAAQTGLPKPVVTQAFRLSLAKANLLQGRLVASTAGIPITLYTGWRATPVTHNAWRVEVPWVQGGMKVAAGFVNPNYDPARPLSTRLRKGKGKGKPADALGPSVAAAFKTMNDESLHTLVRGQLLDEYAKSIQDQINKRWNLA